MNAHTLATRLAHLDAVYAMQRRAEPYLRASVSLIPLSSGKPLVRAALYGRDIKDEIVGNGDSFEAALDALESKLLELDA